MSHHVDSIPAPNRRFIDASTRPILAVAIGLAGAAMAAVIASATSPLIGLVGVIGIACGIGILISPPFGLMVLCFSLPFERIGRLTDDADAVHVSVSRLVGIATLGALLVHMAIRRERLKLGLPVWLYAGFTAIGLLSNAWTAVPDETFKDSLRILGNLLFLVYVINAIRSYKAARLAVMVWMLASLAAGLYSLTDYYIVRSAPIAETQVGLTSERGAGTVVSDGAEARTLGMNVTRMFGTTAHPAVFGLNNVMILPFFFWAIRSQRGFWRIFWMAGLLVPAYCIFLSNTRAVMLLAIFTVAYAIFRRLLALNIQMLAGVLVVAVAIVPFIPDDVYKRTLDPALYTVGRGGGEAIRSRLKLLSKSFDLLEDNFIAGIGVGDQTTLVKMMTDEATGFLSTEGLRASAHNEFVWILVEVGIFGYIFHMGFVWVVTAASFRAAKRFRGDPELSEQYFFMIACQTVLIGVLLWALQSAPFHYALKGWWLVASISYIIWDAVRRGNTSVLTDGQTSPIDPV